MVAKSEENLWQYNYKTTPGGEKTQSNNEVNLVKDVIPAAGKVILPVSADLEMVIL